MAVLPKRIDARNRRDAKDRFLTFLSRTLSCLDERAQWTTGPVLSKYGGYLPEDALTAFVATGPIELERRGAPAPLYFIPTLPFEIVKDDRVKRREFRVRTHGYIYVLAEDPTLERPMFEWHAHSYLGPPHPHVHVNGILDATGEILRGWHLPTQRVSLEAVVRFLIEEFGIAAARQDWDAVLSDAEQRFMAHRRWSKSPKEGTTA